MPQLPEAIERFRDEVADEIRAALRDDSAAPGLYAMLGYHFGWLDAQLRPASEPAGKYLRPALCLLAAEAVGADHRRALPAAAAIELLHNFSLIHDDIQDRSDERHHRPTVWKLFGEPQAIDAGDAALALSELTLLRAAERGSTPATVLAGLRLLNRACLRLAEGQHLDMSFEGKLDITVDEYFRMVEGKTAVVLGCSLELGALFGSDDASLARGYREVGEEIGLAFQVQDDVLGIWGLEARTGKPAAADVYQRKMTLPTIYALAQAEPSDRAALAGIFRGGQPSASDAERAVAIIESSGAREYAAEVVRQHHEAALARLGALSPAEAPARALREIAAFLAARDY